VVNAESSQRGVAGGVDVFGPTVDADSGAIGGALVAELGGEHDLIAASGNRPAHQFLVGERSVHVSRVEEVHSQIEGSVDGGDRLRLVQGPVELAHTHTTQALGGDGQLLSQFPCAHNPRSTVCRSTSCRPFWDPRPISPAASERTADPVGLVDEFVVCSTSTADK